MNYEAWNRYVLMAIGLFGVLLYCGLLYAGFTEFRSWVLKSNGNRKRSQNRITTRRSRSPKVVGH